MRGLALVYQAAMVHLKRDSTGAWIGAIKSYGYTLHVLR
jgi:hypothetical protein